MAWTDRIARTDNIARKGITARTGLLLVENYQDAITSSLTNEKDPTAEIPCLIGDCRPIGIREDLR